MTPLSSVHFHLVLTCVTWSRSQPLVRQSKRACRSSHLVKLADHQVACLHIVVVIVCTGEVRHARGETSAVNGGNRTGLQWLVFFFDHSRSSCPCMGTSQHPRLPGQTHYRTHRCWEEQRLRRQLWMALLGVPCACLTPAVNACHTRVACTCHGDLSEKAHLQWRRGLNRRQATFKVEEERPHRCSRHRVSQQRHRIYCRAAGVEVAVASERNFTGRDETVPWGSSAGAGSRGIAWPRCSRCRGHTVARYRRVRCRGSSRWSSDRSARSWCGSWLRLFRAHSDAGRSLALLRSLRWWGRRGRQREARLRCAVFRLLQLLLPALWSHVAVSEEQRKSASHQHVPSAAPEARRRRGPRREAPPAGWGRC